MLSSQAMPKDMEVSTRSGKWFLGKKIAEVVGRVKMVIKTTLSILVIMVWYQACLAVAFLNKLKEVKEAKKKFFELRDYGVKILKDVIATAEDNELCYDMSTSCSPQPIWRRIMYPFIAVFNWAFGLIEPTVSRIFGAIHGFFFGIAQRLVKRFLDSISATTFKLMSDVLIRRMDADDTDGGVKETFNSGPLVEAANIVAQVTDHVMNSDGFSEMIKALVMDRSVLELLIDIAKGNVHKALWGASDLESVGLVGKILGQVRQFCSPDEMTSNAPLDFNIRMLQHAHEKQYREHVLDLQLNPKPSNMSALELKTHKRLAYYSLQIYQASKLRSKHDQAKSFGIKESDLVLTNFNQPGNEKCPDWAILIDRRTKSVVFAIRGTQSIDDGIIDAVCIDETYLDGVAHKGILEGVRLILDEARDKLKQTMRAHTGFQLAILGHSLGAGSAALLTIEIMSHPGKYVDVNASIVGLCFAPPPVYRPVIQDLDESIKNSIHIYINNQDCVPRISYGGVCNLLSQIREINNLPFSVSERLDFNYQLITKQEELSKRAQEIEKSLLKAVQRAKKSEIPPLEHNGRVHYMIKDNDQCAIASPVPNWFSDNLYLLPRMLRDHFHTSYNTSLMATKIEGE